VVSQPSHQRALFDESADAAATTDWRRSWLVEADDRALAPTGHSLVAHIEHALDRSGSEISERLAGLFEAARDGAPEPPLAMTAYLERLFDDPADHGERRHCERASLLTTVIVIPLSRTFQPCGEPFKAIARDASEAGLSLLHTRAVTAEFLALRWNGLGTPRRGIHLILRTVRGRSLGPFYEVAGEFVTAD
jgi:hypothetical protein